MEGENEQSEKYIKVYGQVRQIKNFYQHLSVFFVGNIILLVIKFKAFDYFESVGFQDEGFLDWFIWNIIGTPIIWGLGLLFHGLYVFVYKAKLLSEFKPSFIREWEQDQLQRFLIEDKEFSRED